MSTTWKGKEGGKAQEKEIERRMSVGRPGSEYLDIGHRAPLSEIPETLVSAGRASWAKVIWQ